MVFSYFLILTILDDSGRSLFSRRKRDPLFFVSHLHLPPKLRLAKSLYAPGLHVRHSSGLIEDGPIHM